MALQREFNWPINPITVNSGPLEFETDGVPTIVNIDTGTPANSTPLPVTIYSPSGPTDFATAANQVLEIADLDQIVTNTTGLATETTLSAINTKTPALGQAVMAASVPVAIASDQSSLPVTVGNFPATQPVSGTVTANQGGTWNITNISGTVSLPTGASTAANQTTGNTSLASIATNTTGLASTIAAKAAASPANVIQVGVVTSGNINPITTGSATSANSLPVVIASDQAAISTKAPVNSAGSYAEITNLTTSAQTFTKPANAVGFVLEALSDNSVNVRYKIGAAATTSSGMRLEPGRDSGYVPCAADISVIAESGSSQVVTVQWVLSQ